MTATILSAIITTLLSGGLIGALVTLYTARQKVPLERDSLIVGSAQTAVESLEAALAAETRRADRQEARACRLQEIIDHKDQRIEALQARLDRLQKALDDTRAELQEIRNY